MFSSTTSGVLALVALQLQVATIVFAADVHVALNIANALLAPDGYPRSAVTANGTTPGPVISGNVGDRFLVNVTDSLTDSTMRRATSVHFHGISHKMDHTVDMDGAVAVTQCPIVPGHSFMYNFSCPQQFGTYWYHAHLSTQYCDGLRGPFIIYNPEDPLKDLYDVDDESTIISVSDWYHSPCASHKTGRPPPPDSTLINGLGRWNATPFSELAVVRAQPGKRHRFRLINMACDTAYTISIDSHPLTVIEADGIETEPVTVDELQIFPGQRYSMVVAMDKPIDNYWIRAIPNTPANSTTEGGINSAILRYDGALMIEPCSWLDGEDDQAEDIIMLKETDLHPLINTGVPGKPYPGGADVVLNLEPSLGNGTWMINNVTFSAPSEPILMQVLGGVPNAKELLPVGAVYSLPANATIEVNVIKIADHPFHLHGHHFDVVRTAGNSTYNFENPVRRDVMTPGEMNDTVTFRFVTDNPGPWFFHCHIDWHADQGLGVVFAEGVEQTPKDVTVNNDWSNLCPLYEELNPDKDL